MTDNEKVSANENVGESGSEAIRGSTGGSISVGKAETIPSDLAELLELWPMLTKTVRKQWDGSR